MRMFLGISFRRISSFWIYDASPHTLNLTGSFAVVIYLCLTVSIFHLEVDAAGIRLCIVNRIHLEVDKLNVQHCTLLHERCVRSYSCVYFRSDNTITLISQPLPPTTTAPFLSECPPFVLTAYLLYLDQSPLHMLPFAFKFDIDMLRGSSESTLRGCLHATTVVTEPRVSTSGMPTSPRILRMKIARCKLCISAVHSTSDVERVTDVCDSRLSVIPQSVGGTQ